MGRTDQRPFARDALQAPQEKLAKPASLFDLPKDRRHDEVAFGLVHSASFRAPLPPPLVGHVQVLRDLVFPLFSGRQEIWQEAFTNRREEDACHSKSSVHR